MILDDPYPTGRRLSVRDLGWGVFPMPMEVIKLGPDPADLIGLVYDLPPQQVPCSWLLSRKAGCRALRWAAKMQRIAADPRFYWHKRKRASRAWRRR